MGLCQSRSSTPHLAPCLLRLLASLWVSAMNWSALSCLLTRGLPMVAAASPSLGSMTHVVYCALKPSWGRGAYSEGGECVDVCCR
ncbi:uncharacterized protein LY79DRAFT_556040, partial [Colletotrichum navitas]